LAFFPTCVDASGGAGVDAGAEDGANHKSEGRTSKKAIVS
jgi:ubiquinol oxidase